MGRPQGTLRVQCDSSRKFTFRCRIDFPAASSEAYQPPILSLPATRLPPLPFPSSHSFLLARGSLLHFETRVCLMSSVASNEPAIAHSPLFKSKLRETLDAVCSLQFAVCSLQSEFHSPLPPTPRQTLCAFQHGTPSPLPSCSAGRRGQHALLISFADFTLLPPQSPLSKGFT